MLEKLHLRAVFPVDAFDLLLAAVNGKVIQVVGLDAKQGLEGIRLHPAEAGPLLINGAEPLRLVIVNAPAVFPHQAEVKRQLLGVEVLIQVRAIARCEVAASPTMLHTVPRGQGRSPIFWPAYHLGFGEL